jgi:Flp pilus assembly protein TadD
LADAYESLATWSVQSSDVAYRHARDAAERAVQLDNSLSQAHSALGNIAMIYDWNFALAEREFRRAVELGPNDPIAHHRLGNYLTTTGDFGNALREVRTARDLDPLSFDIGDTVGLILFFSRKYDDAMNEFRKLIDLDPHYSVAHYRLGAVYFVQGDFKRAIPQLKESSRLVSNREPLALGLYAAALARSGDRSTAQTILAGLLARSRREYISPTGIALLYMALGDENEAVKWMDKMFQDHIVTAVYASVNPLFDSFRSDPRFVAHLKEVNAKATASLQEVFHLASR